MQSLIEKFRFATLTLFFAGFVLPFCSATESSNADRKSLSDVILLIRNDQLLKVTDLTNLSAFELRVARNAVYARHGRPFYSTDELSIFFGDRSWYHHDNGFTEKRLTSNDNANISLIQKAERGTPFRLDNSNIEGAMRLYLEAFIKGDSNTFLTLCHRKHPPLFTVYEIGTLKHQGA